MFFLIASIKKVKLSIYKSYINIFNSNFFKCGYELSLNSLHPKLFVEKV